MSEGASALGGCRLFLVRSSLQFILALALAQQRRTEGAGTSRIVFLPDVQDPRLFEQALQHVSDSPLEAIVTIEPRRLPGGDAKLRSARAIRLALIEALCDARPAEVTVFNDREDAGQVMLIEAAKRFPQTLRSCVEDGAHAYRRFNYRAHGVMTRLRQRLRLGPLWRDVRVLGTHPLVQRYTAIHPPLLREELRDARVQPFPSAQLDSPPLRQFAQACCEGAAFDPLILRGHTMLLSLSSSNYARRNADYGAMVQAAIDLLRAERRPFLFKYHPREAQADWLGLTATFGAREIPRTIPLECVYVLAREQPLLVVGGMSTSLMMAVLLMPHARAAALAHATSVGDRWDESLYEALRIRAVISADGLCAALDQATSRLRQTNMR